MFDLMNLLISQAFAAEAVAPVAAAGDVAAESGNTLMRFAPLFLIFIVFYVLLIRPQQKQAEKHAQVMKDIKKGDKVITRAGFVATITKIENELYVMAEIAKGVEVKVVRDTISGLVDENHPANENKNKNKKG